MLSIEENEFIRRLQLLRQLHLDSRIGRKRDVTPPIQLEELRQDEARRTSADHEDGGAEFGGDFFKAVGCARGGLEEGCVDVVEVFEMEDFALGVGAVFGEAAVH
jgi:hypothetical protein